MANNSHKFKETEIGVLSSGVVSSAWAFAPDTTFVGAYFPAMDDGDIGLEYSRDNGDNYVPVLDPADGDDLVVAVSGADPAFVDISDFVRAIPRGNSEKKLRFTCAAQTGDKELVITEVT